MTGARRWKAIPYRNLPTSVSRREDLIEARGLAGVPFEPRIAKALPVVECHVPITIAVSDVQFDRRTTFLGVPDGVLEPVARVSRAIDRNDLSTERQRIPERRTVPQHFTQTPIVADDESEREHQIGD